MTNLITNPLDRALLRVGETDLDLANAARAELAALRMAIGHQKTCVEALRASAREKIEAALREGMRQSPAYGSSKNEELEWAESQARRDAEAL